MADYDRGVELLQRLGGVARPAVLELFEGVGAADFGAEAVAFVYGGVYQRPDLSLRHRQLVTVAALSTLGYAQAQLDFHHTAARNLGCTEQELREAAGTAGEVGALDERSRLLVLVAASTARGGVGPELREHLLRLRDSGGERAAVEVILHTAVYAGFPAALNALAIAREVLRPGG
ncbi:hypothetical protein GCM10010174_50390 [Kutzneria viridogrisea]|uniref:Carboxymuconolactone decarboxylase-like domain-containing protein n=2 Tax=Kutzneria TaxID=43356 RepID=W5WM81_9PSEU|nr:carboxymuconolactone decarboxylase family protein [Kutzneria albida]AHH99279.1 hypothetical protein KALB_5918 [Kutzneria albida DSM 43870]MBA8923167.1 4-carboxymuconolactone decarboxylase [Kutzneria viridogrisea]